MALPIICLPGSTREVSECAKQFRTQNSRDRRAPDLPEFSNLICKKPFVRPHGLWQFLRPFQLDIQHGVRDYSFWR